MIGTTAEASETQLENRLPLVLPTRVITYAWGEKYVGELLSLTLPALLAPGNLPHVAATVPCEVGHPRVRYTLHFSRKMRNSPGVQPIRPRPRSPATNACAGESTAKRAQQVPSSNQTTLRNNSRQASFSLRRAPLWANTNPLPSCYPFLKEPSPPRNG